MENDETEEFKTVIGNQTVTVEPNSAEEQVDILVADYISDLIHVIERIMMEEKVSRSEIGKRLKKSASTISRQLDGGANLSARTICEYFGALGDRPLASSAKYERLVAKGVAQDVIDSAKSYHVYSSFSSSSTLWLHAPANVAATTGGEPHVRAWYGDQVANLVALRTMPDSVQ
mgnify:CR=1 FL=1|nr:helix-turn-helix domain-containing protein [uncultured Dongia sp.]